VACSWGFAGDEGDFIAVFLAEYADFIEHAAAIEMHDKHLLLRCVRLEKGLTDPHLADVVPNAVIECGDTGRGAKYGADILFCRSTGAHVFHRRGSKDMTVRRNFISARCETEACGQR